MIDPEKLKPHILAKEPYVRRNVVEYFGEGWIQNPEVAPLILQACEEYGYNEGTLLLRSASHQPLDAGSYSKVLDALGDSKDPNVISALEGLLAWVPLEWLDERVDTLRKRGKIDEQISHLIELRRHAKDKSSDELLKELLNLCRNRRAKRMDGKHGLRAEVLAEELGRRGYPDEEKIVRRLREVDPDKDYWTVVYLTDLAGARKASAAVPHIVPNLEDEGDFLCESAQRALARIGDPSASEIIGREYLTRSWDFQLFAAGALRYLKHPKSIQVLKELSRAEHKGVDIPVYLCQALCMQLTPEALVWAREMIEYGVGRGLFDLREEVITIARVHGLEIPEYEEWHNDIMAIEKRQRALIAGEEVPRVLSQALKSLDLDEDDDYGEDYDVFDDDEYNEVHEVDPPNYEPSAGSGCGQPYRREQPKVGRNDPCPCGSGKKYKKCCGRPGA